MTGKLVYRNVTRKEYNEFNIFVEKVLNEIVVSPIIGKNVWIGYFVVIDGSGELLIGDHVNIASGVHIYTHDTVRRTTKNLPKNEVDRAPVIIGNNVFIGANAVIMKGCIIEDNVTVGAGSVLLQNTHIFQGEVWAGNPAKRI